MATKDPTVEQWAATVLKRLRIRQTPGAVQALVGWAHAEGGHWNNQARYNPLNTTQSEPGAGNTGSQGNIKVYKSWDQGIDATVKTLENGRYQPILQGLASGDPNRVADAIGQTPWGTSGGLVKRTIAGTRPVSGVQPYQGSTQPASSSSSNYQSVTTGTPGVDNSQLRRQAVGQFLQQGGVKNPGAVGNLAATYGSLKDVPGTPSTAQPSPSIGGPGLVQMPGGAEAALGWAKSKIGFKETGTNSGGLASYANSRFGMSGQPWCAMFTSLAVTKGGAPPAARTASVAAIRAKAQSGDGYEKGFVNPRSAKSGDLILFGDQHVGMVDHVSGGKIVYVGGNQSNGVTQASVPVGHGDIVRPKYGRHPQK